MRRRISPSAIWRAAEGNRRLDNHVYKLWKSYAKYKRDTHPQQLLVAGDVPLTIENLKKAYHSHLTKPEYRALLLHSRFEPTEWLTNQYNQLRRGRNTVGRLGLQIKVRQGNYYLRLVDENLNSIKLNPLIVEGIKVRRIRAPISPKYIQALTSSGIKQQKVAAWIQEFNQCIFAMVDSIVTTIRITDPLNKFGSPMADDYEDLSEEAPETGSIEDKRGHILEKYERILDNVKTQFNNYRPIADRLGLDTSPIVNELDSLYTQIQAYNQLDRHRDDLLYEHHETGVEVIKMLAEMAQRIESIDLDDPRLNKVAKNVKVPTFVDISNRLTFHKTAIEGASERIKDYSKRMLKKTSWEIYEN